MDENKITAKIDPNDVAQLKSIVELYQQSGYFQNNSIAQMFTKLHLGLNMGLNFAESINDLHVIPGVGGRIAFELSYTAKARRIKASGRYDYEVIEHTDDVCVLRFVALPERRVLGESHFSIADAQRQGIYREKSVWKTAPRNMLFARALSNGVKFFCPDVLSATVYAIGEVSEALSIEEEGPGGDGLAAPSSAAVPPPRDKKGSKNNKRLSSFTPPPPAPPPSEAPSEAAGRAESEAAGRAALEHEIAALFQRLKKALPEEKAREVYNDIQAEAQRLFQLDIKPLAAWDDDLLVELKMIANFYIENALKEVDHANV